MKTDKEYQELEDKFNNAFHALIEANAKILKYEKLLAKLELWTKQFGAALIPRAPYIDSYGEGVRACKEDVSRMLSSLLRL